MFTPCPPAEHEWNLEVFPGYCVKCGANYLEPTMLHPAVTTLEEVREEI